MVQSQPLPCVGIMPLLHTMPSGSLHACANIRYVHRSPIKYEILVYKLADKKREARLLPRAHAQGIKQSVLSVVCRLSRRGIDNIDIRNRDWKQLT